MSREWSNRMQHHRPTITAHVDAPPLVLPDLGVTIGAMWYSFFFKEVMEMSGIRDLYRKKKHRSSNMSDWLVR